ncbi:MAG: GGDEF domain-containing protein [Pseudomonadota bacterium]|nr:GGDEF domain-containing protein [Pseudomonadota bacterium]
MGRKRKLHPWLLAVLLLSWQHGHAVAAQAPQRAPVPAPVQAAASPDAFDAMYRHLNDLGLATQASREQVLQRLDELSKLRPPGDTVRDLRYRELFCGWAFEDAKAQLAYADDGLGRARAARNAESEAGFHYCRATALTTVAPTEQVMAAYEAGIAIARRIGNERLLADGLSLRGSRHSLLQDQARAIRDLIEARRLYHGGGFTNDSESLLLDIAISYRRMGDLEKASEYLRQNETYARAIGDYYQLFSNLLQQGYLAEDQGQVDAALAFYREVLGMAEDRASDYDVASVHLAMAWPYILRKEYRRALRVIEAARSQFDALGDQANDDMIALRAGQAHAGLGRHARAMAEYAQAAIALESSGNRRYQALLYRARAESEHALGQDEAAIADLERYIEASEALTSAERSQRAQLLRFQFEDNHARMENERLASEQALRDRQLQALLQARRWQWTAIVLGAILVLLLAGLVVRQLSRMRRLREMAATDALTGVANRRSIEQLGEEAIAKSRACGLPLCALALDVDHFKTVNDNHGHPCGDLVLARIAHACRDALRHFDLLGRTGGEEFLVLLPDTRLERAWPIAERLRAAVGALDFNDIADGLKVTISIGMAELRAGDGDLRELVGRADTALYRAKGNGRDRVEAV